MEEACAAFAVASASSQSPAAARMADTCMHEFKMDGIDMMMTTKMSVLEFYIFQFHIFNYIFNTNFTVLLFPFNKSSLVQ